MNAETFLLYNLKVAGCLIVFYLLFKILVSRETYHKLNRALLLLGTLSAFILCMPTSITTAPSFTMSAVTNSGFPMATMSMSALRQISLRFRVLE